MASPAMRSTSPSFRRGGPTIRMSSSRRLRIEAIEILMREFGANANGRDARGCTSLHWAAWAVPEHRLAVVDALMALGADVQDVRAAEEGVRVRQQRVHELEEQLRALGVGTAETDESDDEEEEGEESGSESDSSSSSSRRKKGRGAEIPSPLPPTPNCTMHTYCKSQTKEPHFAPLSFTP